MEKVTERDAERKLAAYALLESPKTEKEIASYIRQYAPEYHLTPEFLNTRGKNGITQVESNIRTDFIMHGRYENIVQDKETGKWSLTEIGRERTLILKAGYLWYGKTAWESDKNRKAPK